MSTVACSAQQWAHLQNDVSGDNYLDIYRIGQLRSRFTASDGTKFPVLIVLDNLDLATSEYQRYIYGFAQRLAKDTPAVIVLCLREDTYLEGRRQEGFLSSSALPYVFHVAAPPLDRLLRTRARFGQHALEKSTLPRGIRSEPTAVEEVCEFLSATLLQPQSEALELVAGLAGHNMRDALGIVRAALEGSASVTAKPSSEAAFTLECLLDAVGHQGLGTRCRITNCFAAEPNPTPFHALPARLVAYYVFAADRTGERALLEETDRVVGRFAAWGYPVAVVEAELLQLVRDGVLSRAQATPPPELLMLPSRLTVTAAGYVHVTRLLEQRWYRAAMALITRWYDEDLANVFIARAQEAGGVDGPTLADVVESSAVEAFDAYLAARVAEEDGQLAVGYNAKRWVIEVRSRSRGLIPGVGDDLEPFSSSTSVPAHPGEDESQPVQLDIPQTRARPPQSLPTITRDVAHGGTVWIPRILWALEWSRRAGGGSLSAADIARVLKTHGDLDVPHNNVARAFRVLKGDAAAKTLWRAHAKRYEITDAGSLLLRTLLNS